MRVWVCMNRSTGSADRSIVLAGSEGNVQRSSRTRSAAPIEFVALVLFVAACGGAIAPASPSGSNAPSSSVPGETPPPLASASPVATNSPTAASSVAQFVWSSHGGDNPMDFPGDMALDPLGHVWVADTGNSRFAIFDPDGTFVEYWEHRGTGDGEFILERPDGSGGFGAIAFAPDGSFYVLDVGNHRVEHFDKERTFIKDWGSFGSDPGEFIGPIGLAVDANSVVYVLDDKRDVVERYDADGTVLGSIKAYPDVPPEQSGPTFVVDGVGDLYTSTTNPSQVQKLDPSGTVLVTFGSKGTGPGQFSDQPGAAAVDGADRLFVTQGPTGTSDKVQIFGPDGSFLASFGPPGSGDGQVEFPFGIVFDGAGNVYVTDAATNRVETFRLLPPFAPAVTASPSP
jgi:tripartite motif-containing protein 71